MYQSSTSWVQMPLCKWLYSLPTIGKRSLFTATRCAGCYRSALHHISFVLFLKSRMYDMCCSTSEMASLRMFKYGRTDAIRVTTVDSLKFVQAMQDPTKQVPVKHWSFNINVQFKQFSKKWKLHHYLLNPMLTEVRESSFSPQKIFGASSKNSIFLNNWRSWGPLSKLCYVNQKKNIKLLHTDCLA